jgi:hypothetical protein
MSATQQPCLICSSPATVRREMMYSYVECQRCGNFQVERLAIDDVPLPLTGDLKLVALASYTVRKLQGGKPPILSKQFFDDVSKHELPTPAELTDNLLLLLDERSNGRPGVTLSVNDREPAIISIIGALDEEDVRWAVRELTEKGHLNGSWLNHLTNAYLTGSGWSRIEELKQARVSSRYAFFARKFANKDLNRVYRDCLQPAVKQTGYDLRTVTQKAGHIDAIIEDEIRRCRFLIADLSDDNAGAYWEAGFAEGLGKPVIYICREGVNTHFDTDHRQTVRWSIGSLDETAERLKAVIRNTLLGDAVQSD